MSAKHSLRKVIAVLSVSAMLAGTVAFSAFGFSGSISPETIAVSSRVAVGIESEGIVLLKNEDGALPLQGRAVNVFGAGSVTPFLGGTGSGAIATTDPVDFYDALDLCGINYNSELRNLYEENDKNSLPKTDNTVVNNGLQLVLLKKTIKEMPADKITPEILDNAAAFSPAALIVISRTGSEGSDLSVDDLRLSDEEKALVDLVTSHFNEVIVLFNISNVMEMGWLEDYPQIKAAAIIWIPGEFGMEAVGKMLKGEVNPSGKLADTVAYNIEAHPSSVNFGDFRYGNTVNKKYLEYREGIYVGYRYFETFAPEQVQYPFGYGLSYTAFEREMLGWDEDGETVSISVKVSNTGAYAGKDVVQVYVSPPYTSGGIEKSTVTLVGYAKTQLIEPGGSDTVTVTFRIRDMASYDRKGEQAWVLENGDYNIRVCSDIRSEYDSFIYSVPETVVWKTDDATGTPIKNLFGDAYNGFPLLSRSNPADTFPRFEQRKADFAVLTADAWPAPTPGAAPRTGAEYETGVITLRDVYEDESKWDAFLDQLTVEEMTLLVTCGGYCTAGIERLGIPETVDNDGPSCVKGRYGSVYADCGTAYPCETAIACTFNDELARSMGTSAGTEAREIGTDIWYAPGANIHRDPRGGRNFEYFSEDPLLSGRMAAAVIDGAKSMGLVTTIKHFALNDQEKNRTGVYTWADEQTMREIYLKPFEIAVKTTGCSGIMSAFNRIGTQWCGANSALLQELLRGEWGFNGFVVSDYSNNFTGYGYMSPVIAVYNGNDTMLTGLWFLQKTSQFAAVKAAYERDPAGFGTALRAAVKNICIAKMTTRAFLDPNPLPEDTLADVLIPLSEWNFEFPRIFSVLKYIANNLMNAVTFGLRFLL
jgi:beta-glucosidase